MDFQNKKGGRVAKLNGKYMDSFYPYIMVYALFVQIFGYTFFYRQLDFSSQPGVANEFCEKEAESCLVVAYFYS